MPDVEPKRHGGRRAGAGRKPTLKPLSVLRLVDPQIREQLAELTAQEREASGNLHLIQEQVVARLIQAADDQRALERPHHVATSSPAASPASLDYPDDQGSRHAAGVHPAPGAAAIAQICSEVSELLTTLRRKNSVGQREGW